MGRVNTSRSEASFSVSTTTANVNRTDSSASYEEQSYVTALDEYLPPVLILIGAVCNCLVIKIMRSKYFRSVSTSFFIVATSSLDIFSLLVILPIHWINANFPEIIYRGDDAHIMCKIVNFLGWGTSDLGIILTVGMTTERVIAVMFPMKASKWCNVRKAKQMCAACFIIITIKDFHFLITSDLTPTSRRDLLCFVSPTNIYLQVFWSEVWPWLHNGFLCISFLIILVCNCIIIRYIRNSDKVFKKQLSEIKSKIGTGRSKANQPHGHSRRRQLAMMLLVASFAIIICTLPFSIFVTLDSNIKFLDTNQNERYTKNIISSLCFYLLYVNRCGNFFLYCISGTRFRKSLKIILFRCYKKEQTIYSDQLELESSRQQGVVSTISGRMPQYRRSVTHDTEVVSMSTKL